MRRVVVTGLGAVNAIGNDVPTMWENLIAGKHGIAPITRFDLTDFRATLAAEVKDFDPLLYLDRSEVRRHDLYIQYAIAAAQQAFEDSGIEGNIDPKRIGCYFSSGIGGMTTMVEEQTKLLSKGPRRVSPYAITNMMGNAGAGFVAIKHNCKGPCMDIATACASSTHAVGEAYRNILHGYTDAMVAGGAEVTITPLGVAGFINCQALSTSEDPDRASIPFDKERNGFVMGEGSAALILEEYEHAKARGAKIYAEVVGYGTTCDAHHITAPDPEGEGGADAIAQALAGIGEYDPSRVYVNAHGTSTPMNDKIETKAIKRAFGEENAYKLLVSSTKGATGHMLGAAGATEAVISVLALTNDTVPPTLGYQVPDPECDLDIVPNTARKAELDAVLSTSLGFGGHNGCLAFRKVKD
ncbi:MAG: beta-ketoacyl-ACP synthase II [Candidatus Onthomonas sp.]|nr:beta-ketoacyl-ACP synthase II [Candidatus Onthomonas sp.]